MSERASQQLEALSLQAAQVLLYVFSNALLSQSHRGRLGITMHYSACSNSMTLLCNTLVPNAGNTWRLQGVLAVSRSVGDLQFQPYGLTAEPEFSKWHDTDPADDWLILASDGIFESLEEQQICEIAAATFAGQLNPESLQF